MKFPTKQWATKAKELIPKLKHWTMTPVAMVEPVADPKAWQGVRMRPVQPQASYQRGDIIYFDFGEHAVGHISLDISIVGHEYDSPAYFRILAAELPYEFEFKPEKWNHWLSMAWMQEEYVKFDKIPKGVELPRRYAFRYLAIEVLVAPGPVVFNRVELHAESSGGHQLPAPPAGLTDLEQKIFTVGARTLRNCMQTVLEDGPKRDRRLWLGDLRLEAMANAVTFREPQVIERSLYLLASATGKDGICPSDVFEEPDGTQGAQVFEYPFFFAKCLLEHITWYPRRRQIAEELYDFAANQFQIVRKYIDKNHLLTPPKDKWVVIDQNRTLDKTVAVHCTYLFGLEALIELARKLRKPGIEKLEAELAVMRKAAYDAWFDPATGFFSAYHDAELSNTKPVRSAKDWKGPRYELHDISARKPDAELSVASQVWAVLGKVVTGKEAKSLMKRTLATKSLVQPAAPYLQHYVLEACALCGETAGLRKLIREYWGVMVKVGADTFFEVFRPEDPFYSPYQMTWVNSACHAWSCTPIVYLAKLGNPFPKR